MDYVKQCLGKVSITTNGDWDKSKTYDRLCLVFDKNSLASYISKQKVPANIEITNTEYWQTFALLQTSIAEDYTEFKQNIIKAINDLNTKLQAGRFVVQKESDKDKFTSNDILPGALVYVIDTQSSYILESIKTQTNEKQWRSADVTDEYINNLISKYFDKGFNEEMLKQITEIVNDYFADTQFQQDMITMLGG